MSFEDDYRDKKTKPDLFAVENLSNYFPERSRMLAIIELVEHDLAFMPHNQVLMLAKENLRKKLEELSDEELFSKRDSIIPDDDFTFDDDDEDHPF